MCVFLKEMYGLHCLQEVLLTSSSACKGRADFQKPHITHDAVSVTHTVTSESALSKTQIHRGQKGQVAPLSPQLPRPLMLTWEPAHSADHLVNEGSEQHKRHLARSSGVWALLLGWQAELVALQSELVWLEAGEGKITGQQEKGKKPKGERDVSVQQAVSPGHHPKRPHQSLANKMLRLFK